MKRIFATAAILCCLSCLKEPASNRTPPPTSEMPYQKLNLRQFVELMKNSHNSTGVKAKIADIWKSQDDEYLLAKLTAMVAVVQTDEIGNNLCQNRDFWLRLPKTRSDINNNPVSEVYEIGATIVFLPGAAKEIAPPRADSPTTMFYDSFLPPVLVRESGEMQFGSEKYNWRILVEKVSLKTPVLERALENLSTKTYSETGVLNDQISCQTNNYPYYGGGCAIVEYVAVPDCCAECGDNCETAFDPIVKRTDHNGVEHCYDSTLGQEITCPR